MDDEQQDLRVTLCSRCGMEANWRFLDEEGRIVEILCPDCGRFELPGAEFDPSVIDIPQP